MLSHPTVNTVYFLHGFISYESGLGCLLTKNSSKYNLDYWAKIPPQVGVMLHKCIFVNLIVTCPGFWNWTSTNDFTVLCTRGEDQFSSIPFSNTGECLRITDENISCWKMTNLVYVVTVSLGILSFVLNLLIIATTFGSRNLSCTVANFLVANLACGDLIVSLYSIILTGTRQNVTYNHYISLMPNLCVCLGVLLLTGQIMSPVLTFVITLERYLAIVHCMNNNLRITIKQAYVVNAMAWAVAFSLAMASMLSTDLASGTDLACVPLFSQYSKYFLLYFLTILGLLYLASITMYCHIYINVKKTAQKTEQFRKDNSLARKIALICLTNICFWIIPLAITALITFTKLTEYVPFATRRILWNTFIQTSLAMNSCLNPILFSFRTDSFRAELFKQWRCLRTIKNRLQPMNE